MHAVSTAHIGLVIFPGAITAALLGVVGGRLADRWGSVPIVHAGFGLLLFGYLLLAGLLSYGALPIMLLLIICYSGFAFVQSALAKTVSMTLPHRQAGVGMGLYNLVFFTSGAFGTSFVGTLLDRMDRSTFFRVWSCCILLWSFSRGRGRCSPRHSAILACLRLAGRKGFTLTSA